MIGLLYVLIGSVGFLAALSVIEWSLGVYDRQQENRTAAEPPAHVRIRRRPFDWERD